MQTFIRPKGMSRGAHQPCPTGWPGHDTLASAQADGRRRNALSDRPLRGARWGAKRCPFCPKTHTVPILKEELRMANPRLRAKFDRQAAARAGKTMAGR